MIMRRYISSSIRRYGWGFTLLVALLTTDPTSVDAFLSQHRPSHFYSDISNGLVQPSTSYRVSTSARYNWLGDLWDEVIEFSTYGPAERKMLKERREQQKRLQEQDLQSSTEKDSRCSLDSTGNEKDISEDDTVSLASFRKAAAAVQNKEDDASSSTTDMDGYALRDFLISKWGVPLDVDFQRGYSSNPFVYVTILPVAFGSSKCRHATELDYLMHLQAVIEILDEYQNLDAWMDFLENTKQTPKPGVASVPYRLELSPSQLQKVLGTTKK